MARARTIVLWVLTLEVVTLAVTGAVLYFAYVPTATQAFGPGFPEAEGGELAELVRVVHRWASWLAVPTSLLLAVLLAVRSRPSERAGPGLALGEPLPREHADELLCVARWLDAKAARLRLVHSERGLASSLPLLPTYEPVRS